MEKKESTEWQLYLEDWPIVKFGAADVDGR